MRWVSTFVYGPEDDPTTLQMTLPLGLWGHSSRSGGIARQTATGVPDATIDFRKECLTVPLRFYESEWPAVRSLIEWGQTKAPFEWIPESDYYSQDQEPITAIVTLESPRVLDPVEPEPDPSFPRVLSLLITLRQIVPGSES